MGNYVAEIIREPRELASYNQMKECIQKLDNGFIKTFAQSFSAEVTNDRGEILTESTAAAIIKEWVWFMAITKQELQIRG